MFPFSMKPMIKGQQRKEQNNTHASSGIRTPNPSLQSGALNVMAATGFSN
jgi:hypothetical protein